MVVVAEEYRVNHGKTTSRNGQASHCRLLLRIAGDRSRWATIAVEASLEVPPLTPYDAWTSRVLVGELVM